MTSRRIGLFALACVAVASAATACDSRAAVRSAAPAEREVSAPNRGGRPVPCGLWRPADPGHEPDGYANLLNAEMQQVGLVGPPIEWSRVRNVRTIRVPWLRPPNTVLEFEIDGLAPERAGDMLFVVDDKLVLYTVRPAETPGSWRIDGDLGDEETLRVMRILAGHVECATLDQS